MFLGSTRRESPRQVTAAAFVFAAAFGAFVIPTSQAQDSGVLAYDGFDKTLELQWQTVRPDPDKVSLTKRPGHLTITTELGSLGGDTAARGLPLPKNLFLIDNPVADGGDWAVTTCITAFRPTQRWQQAGLLIYSDDDHYLKNDMEFTGSSSGFKFIREWDQKQLIGTDKRVPKADRIWIRLVKRGNVYERLYSSDGKRFESGGENSWGDGKPKQIGLIAQNGPSQADAIEASFDFIEVRKLTDAERNDPRQLTRESFQGDWEVVSSMREGTKLEKMPIVQFSFFGGRVSFSQNDQLVDVEYKVDPSTNPKRFDMSMSERLKTSDSKGIYRLIDGQLEICLSLQEEAPAPSDFKTSPGDSRIQFKLKRVDD